MSTPTPERELVLRTLSGRQLTWNELRRATGIPVKRLRGLLSDLEGEKAIGSGFPEDGSVARRWWLASEPPGYPEWLEQPEEEEEDWEDEQDSDPEDGQKEGS